MRHTEVPPKARTCPGMDSMQECQEAVLLLGMDTVSG